ncbi:hypothetical protein [Polynucleobacter sphagniphilus]|jgi:predicted small secreted protein|uniref:Small secreted protein n=2 Tax=Polynucleobacter sphagniphilus TaxID=1743169 RepID=A0AA43M8R3_9BURK|nr:hypothetical protein [Polynucleobacter sphagniphilus]MDF9789027.1 putative small secreted protein [Polynucleobacter sphagniphilus]MDH6504223.1 putative small secreted protein [Polynucleobacter sphagniphilus]MDH6512705.1 putative small secreted protein [Polynucleobacter sphagniphilus]
MKIVIAAVLIGLLIPMLTACNTVAGIGEDITGSANWVKNEISSKPVNLGPSSGDANTVTVTPVSGGEVTAKPVQ